MTESNGNGTRAAGWIAARRLFDLLVVLALGTGGWSAAKLIAMDSRLTAVEGNRFTDHDAFALERRLLDRINENAERRQDLAARVGDKVPPAWFVSKVDGLEADLKECCRKAQR